MLKPTVGRIVSYCPYESETFPTSGCDRLAAIITRVWSDDCVNLCVFDGDGKTHSKTSVQFVDGDAQEKPGAGYCELAYLEPHS